MALIAASGGDVRHVDATSPAARLIVSTRRDALHAARDVTPAHAARALGNDARYIQAKGRVATGEHLVFTEAPDAAIAFVLDHAAELRDRPADDL